VAAIKILIERELFGISKENMYIFASGDTYLKGWDALKSITKKWRV